MIYLLGFLWLSLCLIDNLASLNTLKILSIGGLTIESLLGWNGSSKVRGAPYVTLRGVFYQRTPTVILLLLLCAHFY